MQHRDEQRLSAVEGQEAEGGLPLAGAEADAPRRANRGERDMVETEREPAEDHGRQFVEALAHVEADLGRGMRPVRLEEEADERPAHRRHVEDEGALLALAAPDDRRQLRQVARGDRLERAHVLPRQAASPPQAAAVSSLSSASTLVSSSLETLRSVTLALDTMKSTTLSSKIGAWICAII